MAAAKRLKIGFVFDDSLDKPDGVQQYILALGAWLASDGHEVHYLVGKTIRKDISNVHSLSRNIDVRFNGNRLSVPLPTSRRMLREFLDEQQFDVLHVQTPHSPWLAHRLILAAGPQTAIFATFHIVAYSRIVGAATKFLAFWTRRSVARIDKIFSVSPAASEYAQETYGLKTTVLPNVIDYPRFQLATSRKEYNNEKLTILFLGRLVPRKGCLLLLQAIAKLQTDIPFRVIICGRGPLELTLKQYVKEHELDDLVQFTGYLEELDKPQYYASADISVFPSSGGESFGIVLIEAMASGKAVVLAGNNSGYASVMAPRPELLFDPHNAVELAAKLKYYIENIDARKSARLWGKSYASNFDVAVVGKEVLENYKQILRKRRNQ